MKRLKIAIVFGTEPNFEHDAFKYFILFVNRIQNIYEFCFPEPVNYYPFEKGTVNFNSCQEKAKDFIQKHDVKADHCIAIITNSFDNNYFFNCGKQISVITTDIWDKHFSPPSLFEYLLHCIFSCLIFSQKIFNYKSLSNEQRQIRIDPHADARGCIADLTRQKYEDRISIVVGYICEEHTKMIEDYYGAEYLKQIQFIIDRKWIGDTTEKESVAYNLKHIFKFDINRDSGFNKNWWDRTKEMFYDIPGTLAVESLKIILLAILTLFLISWGLIEKT